MNTENEMNEEVRQLLDSIEQHGKNARRQQQLSDLVDRLSKEEQASGLLRSAHNDTKRRKLYPLWWAAGVAAACLLLWLLIMPSTKETPEMNKEILVEETETFDSVKNEMPDVILEEPVVEEELLAAETTNETETPRPGLLRFARDDNQKKIDKETSQEQLLAENITTEPSGIQQLIDTTNIEPNTMPTESETFSTVQSHKRRVIRSLNLVCYECEKEPEPDLRPAMEEKTLFGQPQDPNMKNGSLAFEIKLNKTSEP